MEWKGGGCWHPAGRIKPEKIRHEVGFRCFKCEEKRPSAFLKCAIPQGARKRFRPNRLWTLTWRFPIPRFQSAPIQAELSFLHAPGGPGANWSKAHPDTSINYLDWNGSKWTAKIQGERFLHAPNGDWSKAHSDDVIHYLS